MRIAKLKWTLLLATLPLSCSSVSETGEPGGTGNGTGSGGVLGAGATESSGGGIGEGSGGDAVSGTGGLVDGTGGVVDATGGAGDAMTGGAAAGGSTGTFTGSILIEEEQSGFCSVDGVVESTNGGFGGAGYANSQNAAGAGIEWSVTIGQEGSYTLDFIQANGSAERLAEILVDGVSVVPSLALPSTSDWTTWSTVSTSVDLTAGEHSIVLAAISTDGLANIDSLTVSGAAVSAGDCGTVGGTGGMDGTGGMATGGTGGDGTGGSPNDPITIWIAGDSTVANGNTPCPAGWGKHFEQYFNDQVTVVNRAQGGRSIQTWLYEGAVSSNKSNGECVLTSNTYSDRWNEMLSNMQPGDYLFIQFGINDGDSNCPRHVGGELYKDYLAYMAETAVGLGVTPVFMTPTAAIQCSGSSAVGNRGFLNETRDAAMDNGVALIDTNTLSVELYNSAGLCPNSGNYSGNDAVGQFFCDDHTHFDNPGASQVAGAIAQDVADQGLPLASYLAN